MQIILIDDDKLYRSLQHVFYMLEYNKYISMEFPVIYN